jgi:hypothetical protein
LKREADSDIVLDTEVEGKWPSEWPADVAETFEMELVEVEGIVGGVTCPLLE